MGVAEYVCRVDDLVDVPDERKTTQIVVTSGIDAGVHKPALAATVIARRRRRRGVAHQLLDRGQIGAGVE